MSVRHKGKEHFGHDACGAHTKEITRVLFTSPFLVLNNEMWSSGGFVTCGQSFYFCFPLSAQLYLKYRRESRINLLILLPEREPTSLKSNLSRYISSTSVCTWIAAHCYHKCSSLFRADKEADEPYLPRCYLMQGPQSHLIRLGRGGELVGGEREKGGRSVGARGVLIH